MYLDELTNWNFTEQQIAQILYSFSEFKDIELQRFLSGDKLVNKLTILTLVQNYDNFNYFEITSKDHSTKNQLMFPTGEFKTVSNSSRIIRTATSNHNNAATVSTTINNTRTDTNITLNNRIILPHQEVFLTSNDFDLNTNLTARQSSILLRNVETSSINTLSNNVHQNNYKSFEDEELELAKKYFSFNGSNIIPAPSFQFSKQKNNKVYINSIHIDKLIEYIETIGNAHIKYSTYQYTDHPIEYPTILKYDLGMPFKKILTKEIVVNNEPIQNFIKLMNDKTINHCMQDLMIEKFPNIETLNSGTKALFVIYKALRTFKKYIEKNPEDIKTLIRMTQCINTLVNTSLAQSFEYISDKSQL